MLSPQEQGSYAFWINNPMVTDGLPGYSGYYSFCRCPKSKTIPSAMVGLRAET
jgi:hypothetical protein